MTVQGLLDQLATEDPHAEVVIRIPDHRGPQRNGTWGFELNIEHYRTCNRADLSIVVLSV